MLLLSSLLTCLSRCHARTHARAHAYTHTRNPLCSTARTHNDAAYMPDELVYWAWIGLNKLETETWKWEDGSDLAIHDRW